MATEDQASSVAVQKFSRYRSVRNPKSSAITTAPSTPHASSTVTKPVIRSTSRYRNNLPANPAVSPPKVHLSDMAQQKQPREGINEGSARRETLNVLSLKERRPLGGQDSEKHKNRQDVAEHKGRNELTQRDVEQLPASGASQRGPSANLDTPMSAINAGERRVRVKCNQASVFVRIAPSTTTMDVISSAADMLPESIDVVSSVILECIPQLGLERPLRKYEHIRDVMNSWNVDAQNHLIIVPSAIGGCGANLDVDNVAQGQQGGKKVYMYHSHRPSKWDKRWIILRPDGQVLLAKKDGGETTNICHLSDFDIYVPTHRQMRKLGAPKKICYAIKSQQKSSMFLTTANYVHFFSSDDAGLAADWYKAVQEWRSWYLITVLGKGPNKEGQGRSGEPIYDRRAPPTPFVEKPPKDAIDFFPNARQHGPLLNGGGPPQEKDQGMFAATGLLGQIYGERQKAQRDRETASAVDGPFLPGLLLGGASVLSARPSIDPEAWPRQGGSLPTTQRSMASGLKRGLSKWQKSTPSADVTSHYEGPLLHMGEGRAIVPEQLPLGGLIELATGPEEKSRPNTSSGESVVPHRGAREAMKNDKQEYIVGGLLAKAGTGQGGRGTGRGVMNGDRQAKEAMLDVGEASIYAPGSLLANVEKPAGEERVMRERVEGREVSVPVGEGV
ncbi:hypothetical protein MMC08_005828 [Hypocenomyce scalaris]|nr:hypothetical protein [Hypocenomyce scalaris]